MGDLIEVVITSDTNGGQWTCSTWDPRTGTNVMVYKGGGAASPNSLALLRNEFLVTANSTKPMLHIWPLNGQEQLSGIRFITPGKVSALDISPDGNFLIAGVQEVIHIWHLCSGKMLNALSKHYQTITKLKFTDDGSHFISAGQDGNILVWNLTKAINLQQSDVQPLYTFNDHGLSVTDFHIGAGAIRAFLFSVSIDRTCRIYDLSTGTQHLNLVFPEALQSVTVNKMETAVYVGSVGGAIYEFSILSPPRTKEYHMTTDDYKNSFSGHKGSVTCLSLSIDGETLMSGGADDNIHFWHIPSRQLLRTLEHKGSISNAIFTYASRKMLEVSEGRIQPNIIANSLKRMMDAQNDTDNYAIDIMVQEPIESTARSSKNPETHPVTSPTTQTSEEADKLREEIQKLKKINKELFEYSVKNILAPK